MARLGFPHLHGNVVCRSAVDGECGTKFERITILHNDCALCLAGWKTRCIWEGTVLNADSQLKEFIPA
jgi:hypothetical protein